jgi:hypothetical protein
MILEKIKKMYALANHQAGLTRRSWELNGIFTNPNEAIWFFGCSHVFGTGLDPIETISSQLGTTSKKRVLNFGIPGAGPMMIEHLLDKLIYKYNPLLIIIAWPGFNRWQTNLELDIPILWIPSCLDDTKVENDDYNNHFGCKKLWPEKWKEYKKLVETGQLEKDNIEVVKRVRNKLSKHKLIEFQYVPEKIIDLPTPCYPFIDYARDNLHPGPKTQSKIAHWINNEIQLLL